jgi:hypothetical protein
MIATNLNRLICRLDLYKSYFVPPVPSIVSRTNGFPMGLPRTLFRPILLLLALSLGAITNASAQTRDIVGGKDYPGIGRFGGSVITGYQVKDFDAARMQGATFKDGQPTDARRLEGRITRIAYRTNPGPSILEVSRNFETQLAKAGFATLVACDADACGGIPFTEAVDTLPIPQMWVDGFDYRYYAGRKAEDGRETYASVLVSKNNDDVYALLVMTVLGAVENKMVDAGLQDRGTGIGAVGDARHAALEPALVRRPAILEGRRLQPRRVKILDRVAADDAAGEAADAGIVARTGDVALLGVREGGCGEEQNDGEWGNDGASHGMILCGGEMNIRDFVGRISEA